jgi:hypothetical protein
MSNILHVSDCNEQLVKSGTRVIFRVDVLKGKGVPTFGVEEANILILGYEN